MVRLLPILSDNCRNACTGCKMKRVSVQSQLEVSVGTVALIVFEAPTSLLPTGSEI